MISDQLLASVCCPRCHGRLVTQNEADSAAAWMLACAGCGAHYPQRTREYLDLRPPEAFAEQTKYLDEALHAVGHIPLPPYIASKRPDDERDRSDYQTVYAREEGAVAAPTAGLHFTPALFDALDACGIERHFVTLHVGAGTFLPVKADDTADHKMHAEIGRISYATASMLNRAKKRGGRIVAVGTTSLRLLESAASDDGELRDWTGPTDIFITPGYKFKFVDTLMTNFHLPRSTLFMLVSAFAGLDTMRAAYAHAIADGYRFYSYGDASLLFRADAS